MDIIDTVILNLPTTTGGNACGNYIKKASIRVDIIPLEQTLEKQKFFETILKDISIEKPIDAFLLITM